jgi:hypothetical protein
LDYQRPFLYPKQEAAIFCPERFGIIEASTKSGKTVGSIAWLVEEALHGKPGYNYWWGAPVFPQADIAYRRIKQFLTPDSFVAYATPQPRIELTGVGTTIWIKSADNPDSLYGEDVYAGVGDEITRWKEDSWHAFRSTLTATKGKCRLIGNVKDRRNFAYKLARQAQKGDLPGWHYAKITWHDAVAAGVLDPDDIEDARRTLPETVFRALYEAEADDDGGNPFGLSHIEACIVPELSSHPVAAWGVDLAKKQDYLVLIGLDSNGNVAAFHRWRGVPWRDSIRRIHRIVGEDIPALVDSTGVGDPVLEELQHEHGNFFGFHFTLVGKQKLMEGLAVSIQGREIRFPDGPIRQELDSFQYQLTRTATRYSAPEGENDDCVCSLALARQMWTEAVPGANVAEYMQSMKDRVRIPVEQDYDPSSLPHYAVPRIQAKVIDLMPDDDNPLLDIAWSFLPDSTPKCRFCGQPVKSLTRITDGIEIWHPECGGFTVFVRP